MQKIDERDESKEIPENFPCSVYGKDSLIVRISFVNSKLFSNRGVPFINQMLVHQSRGQRFSIERSPQSLTCHRSEKFDVSEERRRV